MSHLTLALPGLYHLTPRKARVSLIDQFGRQQQAPKQAINAL